MGGFNRQPPTPCNFVGTRDSTPLSPDSHLYQQAKMSAVKKTDIHLEINIATLYSCSKHTRMKAGNLCSPNLGDAYSHGSWLAGYMEGATLGFSTGTPGRPLTVCDKCRGIFNDHGESRPQFIISSAAQLLLCLCHCGVLGILFGP